MRKTKIAKYANSYEKFSSPVNTSLDLQCQETCELEKQPKLEITTTKVKLHTFVSTPHSTQSRIVYYFLNQIQMFLHIEIPI